MSPQEVQYGKGHPMTTGNIELTQSDVEQFAAGKSIESAGNGRTDPSQVAYPVDGLTAAGRWPESGGLMCCQDKPG